VGVFVGGSARELAGSRSEGLVRASAISTGGKRQHLHWPNLCAMGRRTRNGDGSTATAMTGAGGNGGDGGGADEALADVSGASTARGGG
jgi:hypothetical protein